MKRVSGLIERIAQPDNLRLAFWKARKGKNGLEAVEAYRANLDQNLNHLREQILAGKVEVGNYRYFTIYEPKERQICAADFSERVLHHALVNQCHAVFERVQIVHSYASRPGKGIHAALAQAFRNQQRYPWILKLDFKKFFDSIHHEVLEAQLARLFKESRLLGIFSQLIRSYEASSDRGLPIGNLTSQYFANHYLSALDHYACEHLRPAAYIRYMDDMAIWFRTLPDLQAFAQAYEAYAEAHLRMSLKPYGPNQAKQGLSFLGYLVYPQGLRLLRKSRERFRLKYRAYHRALNRGLWTQADFAAHCRPLTAFTEKAVAKAFRRRVLAEFG